MTGDDTLSEILEPGTRLRTVEPGIHSLYPPGEGVNSYDCKGAMFFYDVLACNPVYNYALWGYRTAVYRALCRETLGSARSGWVLDAGCGSLAFTAKVYAAYSGGPVVLLDQSLTLLRKAKSRLIRLAGRLRNNLYLVHGDALALPFRPQVFSAVLALNLVHVIAELPRLLGELGRVRMDGAPLSCTTLVQAGRLADRYLAMWAKAGELTQRTPGELLDAFAKAGLAADVSLTGNLAVLRLAAPGQTVRG